MGPWNEERQLARREAVLRLLQRDDLSEWARNYWRSVYDTISRDEARYNLRVVTIWNGIRKRATENWI